MSQVKHRNLPNILITGTPGVGKSTLANKLSSVLDLPWLEVSRIAKENKFFTEYDTVYCCPVLDDDRVLDYMEPLMAKGGNIVDYHSCDLFPERWFDVVYVLSTNTVCLFDRLAERHYPKRKISENIECEICNMILEEAYNSYDEKIVYSLENSTEENLEINLKTICTWVQTWTPI